MNTEKYLYTEHLNFPIIIFVCPLALVIYIICFILTLLGSGSHSGLETFVGIAVNLALLFVFINFFRLKITVTNEFVEARFGMFAKRIFLSDIEDITVHQYSMRDFLGWGIRYGRNNTMAFNVNNDKFRGILITTDSKSRWYKVFISSKDPEQLVEIIKKLKQM